MCLFLLLISPLFISTQGCHPVTDPLCKDKVIDIQKECHTASLKLPKFNKQFLHDLNKTVQSPLVDTQVWLGYYTPGSWFTLYGDVVRWGNWKLTMKGHSENHWCSHFAIDEYKKWEPTECKDSFPFCEKTERNNVCTDWNQEFQSSTTAVDVACLQVEEESKIYWVGNKKLKFEEAATFCGERNGSLAFFEDRKLWEKVTQSSWFNNSDSKDYSPLYLGIRKQQVIWRTQADDTITWTNWMPDEPKISLENTCVVMNKEKEYQWKTEKCLSTDKKGLCYGDCPSHSYEVFRDKSDRCYFVTSDTGTMERMMNFCHESGAKLSSVPDRMTMDNISQILPSDKHVWLSMTNRLWYSFNGTRVDGLKWRPNEPNNLELNEHCAVLQVNETFTDYIIFDSACTHKTGFKGLCQSPTGELWETSEIYRHIDNAYQECRSRNYLLAVPYQNLLSSSDTLTPTYWGYWVGITDEPRFWYNMEGDLIDIIAMGTEEENCMMGQYNSTEKFQYRMTAVKCDRGDIQGFCVNTTLSEEYFSLLKFETTSTEPTTSTEQTTTNSASSTTTSAKPTTTSMAPTTTTMESSSESITTRAEHMKTSTELTTTSSESTTTSLKSTTTSAKPTTFNVGSTTSSMESSPESTTASANSMKTSAGLTTASSKPTIASVKSTTTSAQPTITSTDTTESTTTNAETRKTSTEPTTTNAEARNTSTEPKTTNAETRKTSTEPTTTSAEDKNASSGSAKVSEEPTTTSAHITTPTTSPSAYSAETTITPATTKIFKTIKPSNQPTFKRLCVCQCQSYSEQEAALEEKMNTVKKELAVQIKDLSSTIRSRTSAQDNRPSSQCIGTSAAILILSIFGIIFATDLLTISKKIKEMHQNYW